LARRREQDGCQEASRRLEPHGAGDTTGGTSRSRN